MALAKSPKRRVDPPVVAPGLGGGAGPPPLITVPKVYGMTGRAAEQEVSISGAGAYRAARLASERAGRSYVPLAFWWLSLAGSIGELVLFRALQGITTAGPTDLHSAAGDLLASGKFELVGSDGVVAP